MFQFDWDVPDREKDAGKFLHLNGFQFAFTLSWTGEALEKLQAALGRPTFDDFVRSDVRGYLFFVCRHHYASSGTGFRRRLCYGF